MSKDSTITIAHNWGLRQQRQLAALGAPYSSFLRKGQYLDLEDSTITVKATLPRLPPKTVRVKAQIEKFARIQQNPMRGSYLYIVSSLPSDMRAKQVAAYLFAQAVTAYRAKPVKSRQVPRWQQVWGGFERDWPKVADNPAMLVISGVVAESTPQKIEKLRDLIEHYADRPRIVVTAGTCPLTFGLQTLRVSPSAVLQLAPPDRVDSI